MATQDNPRRFRLRRTRRVGDRPGPDQTEADVAGDDAAGADKTPAQSAAEAARTGLDAIRAEGLTAQQLRRAMRLARKNGLRPNSAFDAVEQLRVRGIDPFARSITLDIAVDDGDAALQPARPPEESAAKLRHMPQEMAWRARLLVFVVLPTLIAGWYFFSVATPIYATESQFIIQQADLAGVPPSDDEMGYSGQNVAAAVHGFLQSRPAMLRLDAEEGFRAHFQQDHIEWFRRLPPDSSTEAAFRSFQRHVKTAYDPVQGLIRMEVMAASPEDSLRFAEALIRHAGEHLHSITQPLQDSQMDATQGRLEAAQRSLIAALQRQAALQDEARRLSGEAEMAETAERIGALEVDLRETRARLADLRATLRPSPLQLDPLEQRAAELRARIADLRAAMAQIAPDATALARLQDQLIAAEAEVETREMMRAQTLQNLETMGMHAARQMHHLTLSVAPVAPDAPAYPRPLEYTAWAFAIFLGAFLVIAMTRAAWRQRVSG